MNYRIVSKILGRVLLIGAGLLCVPLVVAALYGESVLPFLYAAGIALLTAGALLLLGHGADDSLRAREGFVSVALSWLVLSLVGALPFVFSGVMPRFADALFESVSGLTTTGASVLPGVEGLPKGVLFWRSFSHFIGGMGVLVFMMAVLPLDDRHSLHLLRAEVPGPVKGKLVPRMRSTARILYLIYIALALLETVFLLFGGLGLYDSLLTAFGTVATGGFGLRDLSIGGYHSAYVEMVVAVFMLLAGVNFNLYYIALLKRSLGGFRSEELYWYLGVIAFASLTIAAGIARSVGGFLPGLRYAFFQVVSLITSTGFGTADFNLWPPYARTMLLLIMVVGACAGSTGGGVKLGRIVIAVKASFREVRRQLFPRSVARVTMDGRRLDEPVIHTTAAYCLLYVLTTMLACLLLSLQGLDTETTLTSVISCLSNIGPGLGLVGPMGNFGVWSAPAKLLLCLCMLLGRLEFFPVLLLFAPGVWVRQRR